MDEEPAHRNTNDIGCDYDEKLQLNRDALITRLKIVPVDLTVHLDERVLFTAVAYDMNDVPGGGVEVNWHAYDAKEKEVPISRHGEFLARLSGIFKITAEVGQKKVHATIKVLRGKRRCRHDLPKSVTEISSYQTDKSVSGQRILKSSIGGETGWNEANLWTAFAPGNRRGRNPLYSTNQVKGSIGVKRYALEGLQTAEDGGNSNFNLFVPVIRLPGRGFNLGLDLIYNSNLWHKDQNRISFDIDRDWPAPGWSLGFGKMVRIKGNATMLIDADGTRHPFKGTLKVYSEGFGEFIGHTTDGTLIDYSANIHDQRRGINFANVKYPNGTIVKFTAKGHDEFNYGTAYPTRIIDANGNFITIAYRNNTGPEIDTITDMLGRIISFHYDTNNQLTAITGPGLNGGTRTLIRLHYKKLTLSYNFDEYIIPYTRDDEPFLIDAIYYPATATGFWFGDPDSFSSYGMIAKVSERRGMGFAAASMNEQGTISGGVMTRERIYNYDPISPSIYLTKAPTYTTITETWNGMDVPPSVTQYLIRQEENPRRVEVTYPDGTRNVNLSYNKQPGDADIWLDGLVFQTNIYDASNNLLQKSQFQWEQGDYDSIRLKRKEITDELIQMKAIEFDYGTYNQENEVREYDYGGLSVLRRVHTDYVSGPSYVKNHIFNLPSIVQIYEGYETDPVSRVEYAYDALQLENTPGVIGHLDEWNPYAPVVWVPLYKEKVCDYDRKPPCKTTKIKGHYETTYVPATKFRGNVTRVKTYADAAHQTGAIIKTYHYDITGNLIKASTSLCEKNYGYTLATQYAYPTVYKRWQLTFMTSYDFNTGLPLLMTDSNGRTTQTTYSPSTLRTEIVRLPTMSSISYNYDDIAMTITETIRDSSGGVAAQSIKRLNGLGVVRREEMLNDSGVWNIIETQYDALGRQYKRSQPFRNGQPPQLSKIFYDALGRVTLIQAPDGSEARSYYNELARPSGSSGSPGQTSRYLDAWGRERWTRTDALGNLVEVIEPNPNGSGSVFEAGSLVTTYTYYYALYRLARVIQGAQRREFRYDSLGKLTHQYLPEKLATLNDAGEYDGPGSKWSDVFTYDERSNLNSHTDARGVKTKYFYAEDPLNRLQTVTYDTRGFGDTANPILPAAKVEYEYMTTGDLTRLFRAQALGECTEEYGYDTEGRINSKMTLPIGKGRAMSINYVYDSLNRVKEIRYPVEYGVAGVPRKLVQYDYGVGGQLARLKVDGIEHASDIVYNEASQMTSLKVGVTGPDQLTEEYEFNPLRGFLSRQRVLRAGNLLLDLSYDYLKDKGRTGQVTAITNNLDESENRSYVYDALGRLVNVTFGTRTMFHPDNYWTQEFGYDSYGNRTSVKAFDPPAPFTVSNSLGSHRPDPRPELPDNRDGIDGISYDTKTNRITTTGFAYDAAGNLTRDGTPKKRYQYDAAGRLIRTSGNPKGVREVNIFGVGMQRLIRELEDVDRSGNIIIYSRTFYAWSGDKVIAEYGLAGRWTKSYVYMGSRLCATFTPNGAKELAHYHHPDRLGTRLITNAEDTIVKEHFTFSFGIVPDTETTTDNNRLFTSYDRSSETGLDYAVNRYYDSHQGRFTQVDPLGMGAVSLVNPQSLNMYAYVQNDPVNAVDPNGLAQREGSDITCNYSAEWGGYITCYDNNGKVVGFFPAEVIEVVGNNPEKKGKDPGPFRLPSGIGRSSGGRGDKANKTDASSKSTTKEGAWGMQLDLSSFACFGLCPGAIDISLGFFDNSLGTSLFFTLGGAAYSITPGPNKASPGETVVGIGASLGVSAQIFYSEAQNIDEFRDFSRVVSGGAGPVSGTVSWGTSGAHTYYLGPSYGAGAGLATYNTYTWATDQVQISRTECRCKI